MSDKEEGGNFPENAVELFRAEGYGNGALAYVSATLEWGEGAFEFIPTADGYYARQDDGRLFLYNAGSDSWDATVAPPLGLQPSPSRYFLALSEFETRRFAHQFISYCDTVIKQISENTEEEGGAE